MPRELNIYDCEDLARAVLLVSDNNPDLRSYLLQVDIDRLRSIECDELVRLAHAVLTKD